jgi:7-cyano-7-deazaguanine synthase in queuosine biosynthesis
MYNLHLENFEGIIGVNISGGTDSALLLYLLMKNYSGPIIAFTTANISRKCYNAMASVRAAAQCQTLTQHTNFEHIINYRPQQEDATIFKTIRFYYETNKINRMYTGLTKNPPTEVTNTFVEENTEDLHRSPDEIRNTIYEPNKFRPFTNLDKKDIAAIYAEYNLLDNLFPLTRSCEWWPESEWPDPGLAHCGKCWWCEERLWGFGKL